MLYLWFQSATYPALPKYRIKISEKSDWSKDLVKLL